MIKKKKRYLRISTIVGLVARRVKQMLSIVRSRRGLIYLYTNVQIVNFKVLYLTLDEIFAIFMLWELENFNKTTQLKLCGNFSDGAIRT